MNKNGSLDCFKSYDIRGILGCELNEKLAFKIGYAVAKKLKAQTLVVGHDARESSPSLTKAVINGIRSYGTNVSSLGLAGTEEVYCAVAQFGFDGGIEITASHNPINYNGMKIVKSGSQPLTVEEFLDLKTICASDGFKPSQNLGKLQDYKKQARLSYIKKILTFVTLTKLRPLKIVLNSGNGAAGPVIDDLIEHIQEKGVDTNFTKIHNIPDSDFPNGIPNPLLEENRQATSDAVRLENADFGVAFDGDFDRCFIFDHLGVFIPGEYIVGLLASVFLKRENGAKIIYDPRIIWNTLDLVNSLGGSAVKSKTGHTFVKASMRESEAIYGGEMSAHHYFRDFNYCDSGMIPWLMIWELLSQKKIRLSHMISERRKNFPSSGEINFSVTDADSCLDRIKDVYSDTSNYIDNTDGISVSFDNWRFNIRRSNTEPLVRLNLETRGDRHLLIEKTHELRKLILRN